MVARQQVSRLCSLGVLLLVGGVLQGCASLSETECRTADWQEIGYRDGKAGYPRTRIEDHAEACSKVGVVPDRERYFRARVSGLREYCQPENGLRIGRNGGYYVGVCPPDLAPAFERFYQAGRSVYDAQCEMESIDLDRRRLEERLDKSKDDKEKHRIREDLESLDRRMHHARDEFHYREMWLEREYNYRGY